MGWLVFQDESGVSQRPHLRRTWLPRGEIPIVIHSDNWKKVSICAAIAYRWDGKRTRLYFRMRAVYPGNDRSGNRGTSSGPARRR